MNNISLPLVSIIVVNYNYGRFLADCISSIFAQRYTQFECVVVDNCSTDDSVSILAELNVVYPSLKVVLRDENGGQSTASVEGLRHSSGHYVCFMDADDFLLPDFLLVHMYVHVSSRIQVGITSTDMLQIRDGQMIAAGTNNINNYVLKNSPAKFMRWVHATAPECWPSEIPHLSEEAVYFVAPMILPGFCWSPTSGNVYRRDAVELFANNPDLGNLRFSTDAYFLRGISVFTGSILIDKPCAVYRVHGKNAFTNNTALNGTINFNANNISNQEARSAVCLIGYICKNLEYFESKMYSTRSILQALVCLNEIDRSYRKIKGKKSYLEQFFIENIVYCRSLFGKLSLIIALLKMKGSLATILKVFY